MKLYFQDNAGNKRYLEYEASSREELTKLIGNDNFEYEGKVYNTASVFAEPSVNTAVPAVVGGALGILGGGFGVAIGAAIGALAGESIRNTESRKVESFNAS